MENHIAQAWASCANKYRELGIHPQELESIRTVFYNGASAVLRTFHENSKLVCSDLVDSMTQEMMVYSLERLDPEKVVQIIKDALEIHRGELND